MSLLIGPDKQIFRHHTHHKLADGQHLWFFSGIALLDPAVKGTGPDWKHEDIFIVLTATEVPIRERVRVKHWAPHVSLNAIFNDHSSQWAGWAVDSFFLADVGVPGDQPKQFPPGREPEFDESFAIGSKLAVRDNDGFISRVSYSIHLVGRFVPA